MIALLGSPARPLVLVLAVLVSCGECLAYGKLRASTGAEARWDLDGALVSIPNVDPAAHAVRYVIETGGASSVPDGSDSAAIQAAFDCWQGLASSRVSFERLPDAAVQVDFDDGLNCVAWSAGTLPPGVFALTMTTYYDTGGKAGVIVDADIEMNDDFTWSTSTPGTLNRPDVQSIAAHEIGHFLGLDHSPIGTSSLFWSSWSGAIMGRTLEPDDAAGVSSTYPEAAFHSSSGRIQGTVKRAGAPVFGAWVLAVAAAGRAPAVCGISSKDGTYDIQGLPPGSYFLFVFRSDPSVMGLYYQGADSSVAAGVWPGQAGPMRARSVTVFADGVEGADLDAYDAAAPLEDDGTPAQATPAQLGSLAAAAIDAAGDEDWFSFEAQAGSVVSAGVIACGAGSGLDPRLRIYDSTGVNLLAANDDIVPPTPAAITTLPGPDLDSRIASWTAPSQGTYYARVTSSGPGGTGHYFLYLFDEGATGVDPAVSDLWFDRPSIPADGASTATVYAIPKTGLGCPAGPGLALTITLDGPGAVSAATDMGDGRYSAVVTSPFSPGSAAAAARAGSGAEFAARPVLTYVEPDEDEGCGCGRTARGGPASIPGMAFPFLFLSGIIALLRIARALGGRD